MFASIDHRDVPWRAGQDIELWPSRYNGEPASMVTRPNFQKNKRNPILVKFRECIEKTGEHPHWGDSWDTVMEYLDFADDFPRLTNADPEHVTHARKVLNRLASLTNDKESLVIEVPFQPGRDFYRKKDD